MSIHEITGREYLAVSTYAHFFPFPRRGRWDVLWNKKHVDERGREWWTSRWTVTPFQWLYRAHRKAQPFLCRIGLHDTWDVTEADASVIQGYCGVCKALTRPRRPQDPSPERVEEYKEFDQMAEEYEEALAAYWAGGPCPECGLTGEHEYTCWSNEE